MKFLKELIQINNFKFLYNRLKRMTVQELAHRVWVKIRNYFERVLKINEIQNDKSIENIQNLFSDNISIENTDIVLGKADKVCGNVFDLFALKDLYIGEEVNYHKDYKSGLVSPSTEYSQGIDYRDNARIGDIKYIWELNRHLFLPWLAAAYLITRDSKFIHKFEYFLKEWLVQNPYMRGVNWTSPLELGIRLINWTICWHMISGLIDPGLKAQWLNSIYLHCRYIRINFSKYSSANNHLIGEAAGLFIASTAIPAFKESGVWREKSYKILIRECGKQNYEDGVNKEQSLAYQHFVLDFLMISGLVGRAYQKNFPQQYWDRMERMLEFIAAVEDINGNIPQIGDDDDGYVIDFSQREFGRYRSLLNTGAYIFGRKDFLREDIKSDDKTKLLLNIGRYDLSVYPNKGKKPTYRFDKGGYYLLGSEFGSLKEQKMLFDCGSLGYLSIAAHGHSDALSFWFSAGGCPVFIDPGTYAYHTNRRWRDYFRSTAAHNTVCVDGKDQSIITGSFMWSKKAEAKLEYYKELICVKGSHKGYERLKNKVKHSRMITYNANNGMWKIEDELFSNGVYDLDIHFHVDHRCSVTAEAGKVNIRFEKGKCSLLFDKDLKLTVYEGEELIPLGWHSEAYDIKAPTRTISLYKTAKGYNKVITRFYVEFDSYG
jgi:hypothetical protein